MPSDRNQAATGQAETFSARAVTYSRMSTDHQQYSTENQRDVTQEYAERHGIEILRTYSDEGKRDSA